MSPQKRPRPRHFRPRRRFLRLYFRQHGRPEDSLELSAESAIELIVKPQIAQCGLQPDKVDEIECLDEA